MIVFWVLVGAMTLIALLLLLPPLLRKRTREGSQRDAINLAIARERLKELKAERDAGRVSAERFQETRAELEIELAADLSQREQTSSKSGERWMALAVAILVPAIAIGLYIRLGDLSMLDHSEPEEQASEPSLGIEQMIAALEQRLEQEPDNARGWILLGNTQMTLENFNKAAKAYQQAVGLTKDDPDLLVAYADALARAHETDFSGKPRQLLKRALTLDPENQKALWLEGFADLQAQDHQHAIERWQQLLGLLEKGTQRYQTVETLLARVGKIGKDAQTAEVVNKTEEHADKMATIKVHITLAPALAEFMAPDDTVFIFARAPSGPPMPLAVTTAKADDLPLSTKLDDSMAMVAGMGLGQHKEVMVGARISKTGGALPRPGDLQGIIGPIEVAATEPVEITINEQIR